jgi:hypothetical protein
MKNIFRGIVFIVLLGCMSITSGCAVMQGTPSLTLLSRDINADSPNIEVIGEMAEESDSVTWCLIFAMFGQTPLSHEGPANRLLEKYNADVLVDAEMTTTVFGIPYIFMQITSTTKGRPARFVEGGVK